MIDVRMTTFYRVEITIKVIFELWERTKTPFRLFVVDNNSQDGLQNVLMDFYREGKIHHLILLKENLGLERARNLLLPLVESKYVIFNDNDVMPQNSDPDWLTQLIKLFERNPEYGAIALRPQVLIGSGDIFTGKVEEVVGFPAAGYCRISLADDIRKIGGWRNEFVNKGLGHEEHYLKDKMKELGKHVGYAKDIFSYHFFSNNKNWGYPDGIIAGHRDIWPRPVDAPFDWDTCKPL